MPSLPDSATPLRRASQREVSLGARHGYRFDRDLVHLHAMFRVHDFAARNRHWTLQLWASPRPPADTDELTGHLIAEAVLPPIEEIADDVHAFELTALAVPPAGTAQHTIVLALVADDEVHDLSVYPRPERFLVPALQGEAGYRIADGRVELAVEKIVNPRPAENLSGTLALELWALPAAYEGGAFDGVPLAGVAFDALPGQWETVRRSFDLPFTAPPVGTWHLALMLREWTPAGFITRDFANFATPYTLQPARPAAPAPEAKLVPKQRKTSTSTPRISEPSVADALRATGVSINRASADDLAKVKGVTRKLAEAIVQERPFRSLNELLRVKGMGEKVLAKIRAGLRL